jgi:hypothetical protein
LKLGSERHNATSYLGGLLGRALERVHARLERVLLLVQRVEGGDRGDGGALGDDDGGLARELGGGLVEKREKEAGPWW